MANYIGNFKDKNNNTLIDKTAIKNGSCGMIWNNANITYSDGNNTWTMHDITFNDKWTWNGNGYIIDDGNGKSLSIGDDVSIVEVSGWVAIQHTSIDNSLELHIKKNGNPIGIVAFGVKSAGGGTKTLAIPSTPLSVSKGDKISLAITNASGGDLTLYADAGRPAIALLVKVIK